MHLTGNVCSDIVAIIAVVIVGVITYFKWAYKYWERKNVPYLKPEIPFGTMPNPFKHSKSLADIIKQQYNDSKAKGYKYVGMFAITIPQLMPIDLDLIKNVLCKDFNYFTDRGIYFNEEIDPLSAHLFSLTGAKWKSLRAKLSPTFTSGKMKMMFSMIVTCGNQLKNSINSNCAKSPINMKDVLERYTMDVIGSCAFGINCNSFTDPFSDFCTHSRRLFLPTTSERLIGLTSFLFPSLIRLLRMKTIPSDVSKFFTNIIKESVEHRQKNRLKRNDFLQILIDLLDDGDVNHKNANQTITLGEVAAQAFIFFLAGFETSSTVMTFCLLELSLNPDIQEKLRDEVNAVLSKHDGAISYESIQEMKYMDAVIDETLRKYPPIPALHRSCTMDYNIPNSDLVIRKGTQLVIPLIALQHDSEYYPEPEKFDPDRFAKENRNTIVPLSNLPFGEGPRACIGLRFGLMQTKIGLSILLKHFKFSLSDKTTTPIQFKPESFILAAKGDVWLNVENL